MLSTSQKCMQIIVLTQFGNPHLTLHLKYTVSVPRMHYFNTLYIISVKRNHLVSSQPWELTIFITYCRVMNCVKQTLLWSYNHFKLSVHERLLRKIKHQSLLKTAIVRRAKPECDLVGGLWAINDSHSWLPWGNTISGLLLALTCAMLNSGRKGSSVNTRRNLHHLLTRLWKIHQQNYGYLDQLADQAGYQSRMPLTKEKQLYYKNQKYQKKEVHVVMIARPPQPDSGF